MSPMIQPPPGLVAALARAQAKMPAITKAHVNPHFGSRYADIADVLAVVRPVLAGEGIAIVQPIELDDTGRAHLVTRLMHGTETIESRLPLQIDQKAQDLGSRLTYLRRYALAALVGVAAEDDDDGHAASQAPPRTRPAQQDRAARPARPTAPDRAGRAPEQPTSASGGHMLDAGQLAELETFFGALDIPERIGAKNEFFELFGGRPADTPASMWPQVAAWLKEKVA